jgi:hypothetical protein
VSGPRDALIFWGDASAALPANPGDCTATDLDTLAAIGAGLQAHALELVGALASLEARGRHVGRDALTDEHAQLQRLKTRGDRANYLWRVYLDRAEPGANHAAEAAAMNKEQKR